MPKSSPINLQKNNDWEHPRANGSLDAKGFLRPYGSNPPDLEISYDKACRRSGEVDPSPHFAAAFGKRIELVGANTDRRHHGTEDIETPSEGRQHVMVPAAEAESQERQSCY